MRSQTLSFFKTVAPYAALLAGVAFLVVAGSDVGFDSNTTDVFVSLLPSIGFIVIGGFVIATSTAWYFVPAGFFAIGCGFAFMTGSLYDLGLLVPDMVTVDLTLGELKGVIISLVTLVGAALGATFQRG